MSNYPDGMTTRDWDHVEGVIHSDEPMYDEETTMKEIKDEAKATAIRTLSKAFAELLGERYARAVHQPRYSRWLNDGDWFDDMFDYLFGEVLA